MQFTETFEKQANEKIPKGIDFPAGRVPVGATVQSVAVSASIYPDGTDAAATVLEGIATVTTTRVVQMLKGGVNGKDYRITYLTTLTDGTQLEDDLLMQVRDV